MRASSRGGTLIGIKNKPRSDDTPAVYQPPLKIKLFSSDGLGSVGKEVCFRSTPSCLLHVRVHIGQTADGPLLSHKSCNVISSGE